MTDRPDDVHRIFRLIFTLACIAAVVAPASASAASIFSVACKPSHVSPDDPIVHPGRPGGAHSHDFAGAWSTDASSTTESLLASKTTCLTSDARSPVIRLADKSAYWTPTLFRDGRPYRIEAQDLYVSPGVSNNPGQIARLEPWPNGLRVVADMRLRGPVGSGNNNRQVVDGWSCGGNTIDTVPATLKIPSCPDGAGTLEAIVTYPNCWDGRLDSPDHRAHMAYPPDEKSDCPSSHPRYVPSLTIKTVWDDNGGSGDWKIAGGIGERVDVSAFHADTIFAWDQSSLAYLIDYCLKRGLAQSNTRPCLNPPEDTTYPALDVSRQNPNYPDATPPARLDLPLATQITVGPAPDWANACPFPVGVSSGPFPGEITASFPCRRESGAAPSTSGPRPDDAG